MRPLYFLSAGICVLALNLVLLAGGGTTIKKAEVPKFIQQLSAPTAGARAAAATKLGERGRINVKDVESAVEPLQTMVQKDSDVKVRMAAAVALGMIGASPKETVPILIEVLKADKSKDVQLAAVEALGLFGKDASEAVKPIRDFGANFDKKKDKTQTMTIRSAITNITGSKK